MVLYISLGHNCAPVSHYVTNEIMKKKSDGRLSCPFDLCVTTYTALCQCIENDFTNFFDIDLVDNIQINNNSTDEDSFLFYSNTLNKPYNDGMICNTNIGMWFNHESPGNTILSKIEKWSSTDFYSMDNFHEFKNRYRNRIDSFYYYINECIQKGDEIHFLMYTDVTPLILDQIIQNKFPLLKYKIICQKMDITLKKLLKKLETFWNLKNEEKPFDSSYQSNTIVMQGWDNIHNFKSLNV